MCVCVCVCVCEGAGSPGRCCWRLEREEEDIKMEGSLPRLHAAAQAHAGKFQTHFSKVESAMSVLQTLVAQGGSTAHRCHVDKVTKWAQLPLGPRKRQQAELEGSGGRGLVLHLSPRECKAKEPGPWSPGAWVPVCTPLLTSPFPPLQSEGLHSPSSRTG